MNDDEFLEMCRLAAGPDTGGQCTDKKIDAVEQVEADPRGTVRRLYGLYMAEWHLHEVTAAGMRQMRDYKDRSFVQMGDHAGRLEIERDQLRAALDAATQRAEAAEKDANELRSDNEMNAHYAARALHAEAERDQLLSHLADADQSSMERIAKIDALEAALAAVLPVFYREVCAEAERIIESSGMVSGAHWNAMKIILERRGVQPEVQP